jgi:hypothetical protein
LSEKFVRILLPGIVLALLTASFRATPEPSTLPPARASYLGFDRNDYPGDANLTALRRSFAYTGYWLNNPPGSKINSWSGKRRTIEAAGFGFLVIFNGRTYAEIKSAGDAIKLGRSDAEQAISSARAEGFPEQTVIFLDQEQGGRLLPEQRAYLHAWVDRVSFGRITGDGATAAHFQAGVYCSGIAFKEGSGASIITAEDIRNHAGERKIKYWVVNDSCPPSPGCTRPTKSLSPASATPFAEVWQFAQSPRRKDFASRCATTYNKDGNCYSPGDGLTGKIHLDLDLATSSDPSNGRIDK